MIDLGFKDYVIRRTIYVVITLFAVISINFFIFRVMPGDPTSMLLSERVLKPEVIQEVRRMFGLDTPLWKQYLVYVRNVLTGYLGYSFSRHRPVLHVVLGRLPNTVLLLGVSNALAFTFGILSGVVSAWKRGSKIDIGLLVSSLAFYSLPIFWLAGILLMLFSYYIPIFPIGGVTSRPPPEGMFPYFFDVLHHLFLPAITLTALNYGSFMLLMRNTLLDELTKDYILTARAKGLSERKVVFSHGLRNALLPSITSLAIGLGYVVSGAIVTESMFSWAGVGRLTYNAIIERDYPLLQGVFLIISISVVLANFVADLIYSVLDPRIRYGERR